MKPASAELSPMMEQYRRIKRDHQGEILFFRLGDFYEMFAEDAIEVSALLNLTLTNRNGQPMCGIPHHAYQSYMARLLRLGKKIAVCEQISEPSKTRSAGPLERRVLEVITPGTTIEEYFLDKGSSNYLACFAGPFGTQGSFSFSYIDLSTGDFFATSFPLETSTARLRQELERIQAREIIVQESIVQRFQELAEAIEERANLLVNRWADWLFYPDRSRDRLEKQFGVSSLKGFGITPDSPEIISAGALLEYLDETAKSLTPHVHFLKVYDDSEFVGIDESSQRNLELVTSLTDGESRFSLLGVMDESRTAMGRRLLKTRILRPLRSEALINRRLDMVELLYRHQETLNTLREHLSKTPDLQRLCSRLAMDKAHGKDLVAVKNALSSLAQIESSLDSIGQFSYESSEALSLSGEGLTKLASLNDLLERSLAEDPSILLTEGNLIRDSYHSDLDRLKELRDSGRKLLEAYLEEERALTGIPTLKIRYNKLIGYFFEVTKLHLSKVPAHFIRRQGIAGGERFSTERLAALESDINSAFDKIVELERALFLEIRGQAKALLYELSAAGRRIAEIDAAQSLARAATVHAWNRPVVDGSKRLCISGGRHPVVEAHLKRGEFIPNDLNLDAACDTQASAEKPDPAFALITGPNMAGKSTYLRQAALITLMAQAGSFVPAERALVGLVDRIYCRVGASDNLARGESTFLVEMNETAYILHSATAQSLVIMDEVGRGTSTEDGFSIAQAVCEELLTTVQCRTLFATHYHELSAIVHERMANFSMDVADDHGEIVFLRKLKNGPAEKSYGLHVAALAGLSDRVIQRAEEIMLSLSSRSFTPELASGSSLSAHRKGSSSGTAGKTTSSEAKIIKELTEIQSDIITPLEALNVIHRWKKLLASHQKGRGGEAKGSREKGVETSGTSKDREAFLSFD